VLVLEREPQPGYHSTGRSAAMFIETYGTPAIRALTRASRAFYEHPPEGFSEYPLLTPRGVLYVAREGQQDLLESALRDLSQNAPDTRRIRPGDALALVPVLRAPGLCGAIIEEAAQDIDVHALHQGYLRGLRSCGGVLRTQAELAGAQRLDDLWVIALADGHTVRARAGGIGGCRAPAVPPFHRGNATRRPQDPGRLSTACSVLARAVAECAPCVRSNARQRIVRVPATGGRQCAGMGPQIHNAISAFR